ncbi:hypothetical protein CEP53_015222, partial [Fusarium sp. AF-6]
YGLTSVSRVQRRMESQTRDSPDLGHEIFTMDDVLRRLSLLETALSKLSSTQLSSPGQVDSQLLWSNYNNLDWEPVTRSSASPAHLSYTTVGKSPNDEDSRSVAAGQLPPVQVLRSVIKTYFSCFHNQPYSFFHETSFMKRFESNCLPNCLLLAVLALAVRFSEDYHGQSWAVSDAFSHQSWLCVLQDNLSHDEGLNLDVVQTATILSIVDYTGNAPTFPLVPSATGRLSAGWLRLGVAIRVSQDMNLTSEPPPHLSIIEGEERRRTFWAMYIVDKLMSCSRSRPAAIDDQSFSIRLPCDEQKFLDGDWALTPTLGEAMAWDNMDADATPLGSFGLCVLASSVFSRCVRYAHGWTEPETLLPWDPRSDFNSVISSLLLLESHLNIGGTSSPPDTSSGSSPAGDDSLSQHQANQLAFANAIFHLCHCLLNHPFLVRLRLRRVASRTPNSFASRAFDLAQEHARQLSHLLSVTSNTLSSPSPSFYSYCASVAASIHSLAMFSSRQRHGLASYDATKYFRQSVDFMEKLEQVWPFSAPMKAKILALEARGSAYATQCDLKHSFDDMDCETEEEASAP